MRLPHLVPVVAVGLIAWGCTENLPVAPATGELVDTVVVVDTVLTTDSVITTDTVFVIVVDTVITTDTILTPDTVVVVDTLITTDTLTSVDTVIVISGPAPAEEAAVYSGSRGLVIDTRELLRKGYVPTSVEVSFAGYGHLDTQLEVDDVTSLAILTMENDSLTEGEQTALEEASVDVTIVAFGDSAGIAFDVELARVTGERPVDASNRPVVVDNPALPFLVPPLVIPEGMPVALAVEGREGVLTLNGCNDCWTWLPYGTAAQPVMQEFFFLPVDGQPDTYTIENFTLGDDNRFIYNQGADFIIAGPGTPAEFVVEQDAEGWVRLRISGESAYLHEGFDRDFLDSPEGDRFRILIPSAQWQIEHLGTSFNQPVKPPAQIALAIQSTVRNCSVAEVVEVVGRTQSRAVTTSFSMSESFQMVSENTLTVGNQVDVEANVNYEPPFSFFTGGAAGGVTVGYGHSWDNTVSTTSTVDTTRVSGSDTVDIVEITRTRQITVPPYSAVTAVDWVRTIEGVRIPWVQRFRFRGYDPATGERLTGYEIVTQLRSNGVGVIVTRVGDDFVEFTRRGSSTTDNFYQSESTVRDIPGSCSNRPPDPAAPTTP